MRQDQCDCDAGLISLFELLWVSLLNLTLESWQLFAHAYKFLFQPKQTGNIRYISSCVPEGVTTLMNLLHISFQTLLCEIYSEISENV